MGITWVKILDEAVTEWEYWAVMYRKKREKRGWGKDRNWSQREESSQANKQTHKWKWILKTRLAKLQNQKCGKHEEELDSTIKNMNKIKLNEFIKNIYFLKKENRL